MDLSACENLLCHYENVVLTLHECHKKYAFRYKYLSNFLTMINIILGTITGTSSISIYNTNNPNYALFNIIFIYIMTIVTSFQKMLEPSKKYERFRNASEEYLTLFYEIKYKKTFDLQLDDSLKTYVKDLNIKLEDMRIKYPFINDDTYDMCKEKTIRKIKSKQIEIDV